MPADRVGKITAGRRGITANTALRLACYDLDVAEDEHGKEIDKHVQSLAG